jgi:hypothetical protein
MNQRRRKTVIVPRSSLGELQLTSLETDDNQSPIQSKEEKKETI